MAAATSAMTGSLPRAQNAKHQRIAFFIMAAFFAIGPFVIYPLFLMKVMCFALFACAFNLLLGYVGLLSFGHALFFGGAGYVSAHAAKMWGGAAGLALP